MQKLQLNPLRISKYAILLNKQWINEMQIINKWWVNTIQMLAIATTCSCC